jgi:hypothetical protein
MAIEKLNPMIRPNSVRIAVIIVLKSPLSFSARLRRLFRKKTPICTEIHSTTRERVKTKDENRSTWLMRRILQFKPGQFTASCGVTEEIS